MRRRRRIGREREKRTVDHLRSGASAPLARMWLNARHLSRFSPALGAALDAQDRLDRDSLVMMVQAGIDAGVFATVDPEAACTRILLAVDGSGSYANSAGALDDPVHARFVADVAEWTLGLVPGSLD